MRRGAQSKYSGTICNQLTQSRLIAMIKCANPLCCYLCRGHAAATKFCCGRCREIAYTCPDYRMQYKDHDDSCDRKLGPPIEPELCENNASKHDTCERKRGSPIVSESSIDNNWDNTSSAAWTPVSGSFPGWACDMDQVGNIFTTIGMPKIFYLAKDSNHA